MIKHLTVVVTLFWLPIATALPALAQTPPAPPPAVVTEAQRFALVAGRTLTGEPQEWDTRTDERTGHIVWAMRWRPDTTSPLTVEVKVNEQTGKAVDYDDMLVSAAATAAYQSGQTVTVTQEQAVAKLDALLAGLPVTPGDWRLQTAELESHIQNDGSPGQPYWFVSKRRYFDGVPVFPLQRRTYQSLQRCY